MYILIQNDPLRILTFEAKSDLAEFLGLHRNTITNLFNKNEYWESDKGIVHQSYKHFKVQRGGNSDSYSEKQAKKDGIIPCKGQK